MKILLRREDLRNKGGEHMQILWISYSKFYILQQLHAEI